ncbi:MAG: glycosyltransferase family 4 protein [Gemmatimonadetes bacterium]|nr:glycosyltransferase family 4 protein [Gemmatimonadota bacterium]
MKLLLVSFIADAPWTGMGRWTYQIKAALEHLGHTVETWFANDFPRTAALGRLGVLVFPVALAARLVARRRSFDAVVVHEPSGFWYGLLRRLHRRLPPLIAMCHNVESRHFRTMVDYTRRGLAQVSPLTRVRAPLLRYWQSDGTIKLADHVLCLSTVDARYLTEQLGVAATRVTRFVNGAAPGDFVSRPAAGGRGTVLWVGGWLDVKGRRVLPRLWRRVREQAPEGQLTVAGTGIAPVVVLAEFDPRDRDSIAVLPRVERAEEMRALYAASEVYLLCSLSEGSPLSLLEAMAAGTASVATRVGGVPDLVADGTQALLFDPDDIAGGARLVSRLLGDPSEARRLGDAARQRARELTWGAAAAALAGAARSVAGGSRAG